MRFQWLPTQYTFPQVWLLHFQNWLYSLKLSSGTLSARSLFDFSIRLAPHSGHLVSAMLVSQRMPKELAILANLSSSVSPTTREDTIFFATARWCNSLSLVSRTILFSTAIVRRSLSFALASYLTSYPSIRNHLASPPSIPSTRNLIRAFRFSELFRCLALLLSLPRDKQPAHSRWWCE